MTEPTTPTTEAATGQEPTQPAATPPWGSDENFDPQRAWTLIQNLRTERAQLAERPTLTPEQQQQLSEYQRLVEASQTEQERQANALAAAQREAETARADAIRYRVAAQHGIPAEDFDLLGSGTEEEITARAVRIQAKNAALAVPPSTSSPAGRPVEQLRPGASPSDALSEDDVLYQSLYGSART